MLSSTDRRYITAIELTSRESGYPFTIPAINALTRLEFRQPVTYLIGENGSGKSTLLEAIAIGLRVNPEGGNRNTRFRLLETESSLHKHLMVHRTIKRLRDAFFLRAETMFNLYVAAEQDELALPGYSWRTNSYDNLKNRSHGESHLELIANKMSDGVYLFDEPESGLSVERQMVFLAEVHRLVTNGSQVIIATHSPIILSYPNADIYDLKDTGPKLVKFEDSCPYHMTKLFMQNHQAMVRELLEDDPSAD